MLSYFMMVLCGGKVKEKSNRSKYCGKCWKEKERELKRETWNKNKEKYRPTARRLEKPHNPQ